ncbi:MATE family efflux transporter [Candidatus Acetatifactor stercoripullorum]|uniref:MATE family efflux transporter n=1 Tax=Candidatus Acetatifactor stercoripullorum TaxID=2838414 RepID=UPI00298E223E|nr:MATE family efflux transporter [Candidatus Acetatifactor stercoripullorum]
MEQKEENKLGVMPVGKLLVSLALPSIAAQIVNLLYNLVDRIYIGHIPGTGALALTGLGVTLPVITLIAAFAALIGFGGAPRASIAMGKGDYKEAEKILGNCVFTLCIFALVLTAVFYVYAEPILYAFGASGDTIGYAVDYMRIYVLGTLFVQITTGLNAFITGQGFASTGMKTVLIGAGLNLVLDPVFIFGLGMGVQGAALATILSQAVSAVWVLCFLSGKKTTLRIRAVNLRFSLKIMGPVLALGVSPFIMQATESLLSVCFNTSLQKYGGDVAVGAMTILSSVMQASMLPLQGMTQGMQPIASFNYGAGKLNRVRKVFLLTLGSCLAYSFLLWAIAMLFPQGLARIFTTDQETIQYTQWAMRIYMAVACIFGAQIACQQTFVALGKAVHSLFLAVLRKVILLIPMIYILPNFFEDKVFAVFLAEPVSDLLAVCTTVTLFFATAWKLMNPKKQ